MSPTRIVLIERIGLVVGLVAMVAAVASVEWRAGLFLAGLLLAVLSSDIRIGRRP